MTPEQKARALVMNYRSEISGHGAGELEIEIAQVLREARAEGMREAARILDDNGDPMADLIRKHAGESNGA